MLEETHLISLFLVLFLNSIKQTVGKVVVCLAIIPVNNLSNARKYILTHSIYFILLLCSVSLHTKTHDNTEVIAYQKITPYVQTLRRLNHSQSQSINKLQDHLENVKVSITVTFFSCLTVNDVFFCLQDSSLHSCSTF